LLAGAKKKTNVPNMGDKTKLKKAKKWFGGTMGGLAPSEGCKGGG